MSRKKRSTIIVPDDPPKGPPIWLDIILLFIAPPVSTFAGLYLLFRRWQRETKKLRYKDYRHYAAIIGDRGSVSIRELATRLGKSPDAVADDLQGMINADILDARAYVDRSTMTLYLPDEFVETEFVSPTVNIYVDRDGRQARTAPETVRPSEPVREAAEHAKAAPEPARVQSHARAAQEGKAAQKPAAPRRTGTDTEDFEEKLREIKQLNEDIDNELVSERIDRIGALTASIFRVVREKPERAEEVRKFMNYYLPTTLKLLKSYSLMEKQSYQGENIQASRKKIEDVLESLVHAFERQQDKLFQSDALDVETDISVLETMMASDGLTQTSQGLHL